MSAPASSVVVGEQRQLHLVQNLTRAQVVQYAGASGDYNPLHTDEPFARDIVGIPGVFAHGMLTMGMTARVLTEWFDPEHIASYSARFAAQVWPGDSLTALATIESVETADGCESITVSVETKNQRTEAVLLGSATIRRPVGSPDVAIGSAMSKEYRRADVR